MWRKYISSVLVGFSTFVLYLMVSGTLSSLTLITGILTSLVTTLTIAGLADLGTLKLGAVSHLIAFTTHFLGTELKEHIEMTKFVLTGKTDFEPRVVEVPYSLESETAAVILALAITNTPGTIALDINHEERVMLVHWLTPVTEDPQLMRKIIFGSLEEDLKKVFR